MRRILSGIFFLGLGLLAGCSGTQTSTVGAYPAKSALNPISDTTTDLAAYEAISRSPLSGSASLPDRGELLAYDKALTIKRRGAYTAYPVALSEAHALNAIGLGREMTVTAPDGSLIHLKYDSHVENPDGNWSWIGHDSNGAQAILTFGERAVFGSIPQGTKDTLRLTMSAGRSWMVATDRSKLAALGKGLQGEGADQLVPPKEIAEAVSKGVKVTTAAITASAVANARVDVLLGYTKGLSAQIGSDSAAVTRLVSLIAAANAAYTRSGVALQVRLVGTVKVDYADNTDNGDALEKLTGRKEDGTVITPDPAFSALRAARETTGADLVSLVRAFRTPENNGCGIAWLIGGGQTAFSSTSSGYGYSVIGDGTDLDEDDDNTYFCRDETLVHEMGHNMGQQHDTADSEQSGVHAYSYGYRETAVTGFYTIMAYPLTSGDATQVAIPYFANPSVKYSNRLTGIANAADNVRSMNQTMPIVATFRATVVPVVSQVLNLYAVKKNGTVATEVHSLTASSNFKTFLGHFSTGLGKTGSDATWTFAFGDYNGDGTADLYAINKMGGSGRTEVHILSGVGNYRTFLLHQATGLGQTGRNNRWEFKVGDYNGDRKLDIYAIDKTGNSGKTEVHVLNGASKFQNFLAHSATALAQTGVDYAWRFELGDYDNDNKLDLYIIRRNGTSGRTEVHVLRGASGFTTYLIQKTTALASPGSDNSWDYKIGDFNRDGVADIYAIKKNGVSAKTEVHVLNGDGNFQSFLAHFSTGLQATGSDASWAFGLVPAK